MHIGQLFHFYRLIIQSLRFFCSELIARPINNITLLLASSSCRISLLYRSFSSFSRNRVHWVSCNLRLMSCKATWDLLIWLWWIALLALASSIHSLLASKIESCYRWVVSFVKVHSLFTNCLSAASIWSFVRLLLTIIENHRSTFWWNTIKLLLFCNKMYLRLRLDLIATTCKHLLLLLIQLPRLHLLHIWLLTELERRILTHLNKLKSLIHVCIIPEISICLENVLLKHGLCILLHYSVWLWCSSILILALASWLLMVGPWHFYVRLCLHRWACSVVEFSSILYRNVRNALKFQTLPFQ